MPPTAASITSIRALVVMSILIYLEIIIYLVPNFVYQRMHLQRKKLCNKTDNFDPCRTGNQIDEVVKEHHHAFFEKEKISRTALLILLLPAIKD